MPIDTHVGQHCVFDRAILTDKKSRPTNSDAERSIHVIHLDRDFLWITEKNERQFVFLSKTSVAIFVLWTNTGNLQSNRLDIVVNVANSARFFCATGREIRRVEVQNQGPILQEIRSGQFDAFVAVQNELRGLCSSF